MPGRKINLDPKALKTFLLDHQDPSACYELLIKINRLGLLDMLHAEANFQAAVSCSSPLLVNLIMDTLNEAGLLSTPKKAQVMFAMLMCCSSLEELFEPLHLLHANNLLTKANVKVLVTCSSLSIRLEAFRLLSNAGFLQGGNAQLYIDMAIGDLYQDIADVLNDLESDLDLRIDSSSDTDSMDGYDASSESSDSDYYGDVLTHRVKRPASCFFSSSDESTQVESKEPDVKRVRFNQGM